MGRPQPGSATSAHVACSNSWSLTKWKRRATSHGPFTAHAGNLCTAISVTGATGIRHRSPRRDLCPEPQPGASPDLARGGQASAPGSAPRGPLQSPPRGPEGRGCAL